ncbi:1-phosphofructokinase family hexose kinase [Microbacterium sp. NPDC091313]
MIVTLTANPSLDRTVDLAAALAPGAVQLATGIREDAGGKGVNVSRVVAAAGLPTLAIVPVSDDDPYRALLDATGIPVRTVPAAGHARENLTITDPEGVTTKLNLAGARATHDVVAATLRTLVDVAEGASWVVLAGSLPPGFPESFYADAIIAVRSRWKSAAPRIAVDASGPALRAALRDARPDLIKPNESELAELVGGEVDPADPRSSALAQARTLVPDAAAAALVTLGGDGALLLTAEGAVSARPPRIRVASTVGAGDSSLAGYLIADVNGADAAARLSRSVAYGAAAASLPGTQAPRPDDLPAGTIAVASVLIPS